MTPHERLLRLRAGADVKRYHTGSPPIIGEQLVGQHSANVQLILLCLHPQPSRELLITALTHDLAEFDTGDTPAHVKWWNPDITEALKQVESTIETQLGLLYPLTPEETQWLGLADTLEYMYFALEQRKLGNRNADIIFERGTPRLRAHPLYNISTVRGAVCELIVEYNELMRGNSPRSLNLRPETAHA
jgi:hypothetical protein